MKTTAAPRVLSPLIALLGLLGPAEAQVSNTYRVPPPPGYPAAGSSAKSTKQSAATVQSPATYPRSYSSPPGYTYPPPPGYGAAPAAKTSTAKPSTKTSASSKKPSAGPPPPPSTKVYGPTGDLSAQVARLQDSDKVQNHRLGELERDVSSIKRGGKISGDKYDGGTDLAAHTTYVARPGDTLWRIATTHRVSVGEIQQLNRMTAEEVRVGQTLLIPSPHRLSSPTIPASYTPSTPGGRASPVPGTTSTYTVKKGDSLKAIAIRQKMTTAALASANGIKDPDKIFVGQRLKIPGRTVASVPSPPSALQETADTIPLPGFGISTPTPPAAGLSPAPAAADAPPPSKPAPIAADSHRGILAYRVDHSDSIDTIAQQFSTTPERIREINRLSSSTMLKPGDEIMVPAMGAVSVAR